MSDKRSIWCRHYTSPLQADSCRAGIAYDTVARPVPCVKFSRTSNWGQCPAFSEYTTAELDQQEREKQEGLRRFLQALAEGTCPHCGATVERREQVGRCVYGRPCGHRLYQGRV
jgi:hypothetical protein